MPEDRVTLWQAGNPSPCIARPFGPWSLSPAAMGFLTARQRHALPAAI